MILLSGCKVTANHRYFKIKCTFFVSFLIFQAVLRIFFVPLHPNIVRKLRKLRKLKKLKTYVLTMRNGNEKTIVFNSFKLLELLELPKNKKNII